MSHYDPDAPERLSGYGELVAFADLRGGLEYVTEYVNREQT